MGAGLIYAGIVAVWAVVLAPMWIRRSDERFDPVMAARTSAGIRVLTRRRKPTPATATSRPTVPPATARAARYAAAPVRGRPAIRRAPYRPQSGPRQLRRTPLAYTQRRRFLLWLAVVTVGLVVSVVLSAAPQWVPALPLVAVVSYLLYVRGEAKRAYERKHRERSAAARRAEARRRAELHAAAMPSIAVEPARRARMNPDGTWEPVEIPLPTYVTAPVATRRNGRPIVLDAYGAWTRRRMGDLMRGDRTVSRRELIMRRVVLPRAVNE